MAIASMILGILCLVTVAFCWIPYIGWADFVLGLVCGVVGIILGICAKKQDPGNGKATVGIVLSLIGLILVVLALCACVACLCVGLGVGAVGSVGSMGGEMGDVFPGLGDILEDLFRSLG